MRVGRILFLITVALFSTVLVSGQDKAPKTRWAQFETNKIRYYDIGDQKSKKALVFIHGGGGSADLWRDSYSAFPKYRVIALDLIGHGNSDKPRTDYTMDYFAKSVEAVMNAAKVDKAVFVGHSLGMPVARQFYRMNPNRTLGIVNVDGAIRLPDRAVYEGFLAAFRADYKKASAAFLESMLATMKDESLKQTIRNTYQLAPDHVGMSVMNGFDNDFLWKTDPMRVPVLALFAESPWLLPDNETFMRSIAPNLEYHMWKGTTHFLHMEKPKEFNELIRAYVVKNKLL
jgi:pimeloyl-ACP methyl ester carboxylesterase